MQSSITRGGRRAILGYSLIEMAVVIAVGGMLLASFASAYNLYAQQQIKTTTELNVSLVTSALSNFLVQKGRYPCPARMDAQRTDADYGMETECSPVTNCDDVAKTCNDNPNYPTAAFGTCPTSGGTAAGQGLCFEQSSAYVTINNYMYMKFAGGIGCYQGNGNASKSKGWCPGASGAGTIPAKITIQPPVRHGIVPFRTLALPEDVAFDGYGNRLQYAVSENQAVTGSYDPGKGAVRVLNAQGQPYFNVTVDTPILKPDSVVSSNQWNGAIFSYYNETTTANVNPISGAPAIVPTIGTSNTTANTWGYGNDNQDDYIEFSLTDTTESWPAGAATLTFTAARTKAGVLTNGGNSFPKVTIRENGVDKVAATSACTNGTFAKLSKTWQEYNCVFDASVITDWNAVTVKVQIDNPTANVGLALGWLQLKLPTPLVGFTDYFLFSSGKDKAGAYTRWAKKPVPCATATLDALNCAAKTAAEYRMAEQNDAYVADATRCVTANCHFDDYAKFYSSTEIPLWRISGTGAAHIRDLMNVENGGAKIAIATAPDAAAHPVLQVGGEIRLKSANAMFNQACDVGSANCFKVGNLADPVAQAATLQCPPVGFPTKIYATGFANGVIQCSDVPSVPCATGQLVTGVKPDGTVECSAAVGCPSVSTPLCFNTATSTFDTATIPSGIQGQSYTTPNSGFNYNETWQCGPVNAFWTKQSSSGICNCTPVDETYDVACNARWTGNWTGNITVHHTHTCPDDVDNGGVEVSNTCICANTTESYTDFAGCGPGFSGSITYTRTWDCTSGTAGAWSAYTQTGNTCNCQPQASETRTLPCPTYPASTGSNPQQRDWTCPAGSWSAWYDSPANTCACNASYTDTQDVGCTGGWSGTHTQKRTFDCATNTWNAWVDDVNTCSCTPQGQDQTLSCQVGYSGAITQHRDFTCPAATWTSWTQTADTCTCTGAQESQVVACDAPLAGTKQQRRDYDCGTNSWGAWYDTSLNCYANTFNWTAKTAAEGPYITALAIHAGDTCTVLGDQKPCSAQAPAGLGYYHYATCQCE